jgi:HlyD family secretion protein
MKFNKRWLAAALVLAVLAVPFAIAHSRSGTGVGVDVVAAAPQEIRPTILASGVLAYRTEVNLTAELVAKVSMIAVKEGDSVVAGQLLMRLDPEVYRNAIEREQASRRQSSISIERQRVALDLRQKQFERSRKMLAAQMIDQSRFDEDRNQLELAKVDLQLSEESFRRADAVLSEAQEQLAKTEIRSPIAGRVVSLPIKIGETAIPSTSSLAGAQLMKIADTSALQAELKVDEADIARIGIGQAAKVYAAAYPDLPLKGVVQEIALAPTIEGLGRAYKVTVLLTAPKGMALRSGMSARADILLSRGEKRLAVPVEAVGSEAGEGTKVNRFLWLMKAGKASKVMVDLGASDDRLQEITRGLAAGDKVVTGPAKAWRVLREGDRLSTRSREEIAKADGEGAEASE